MASLMFRSRLVPRVIPVLGLVGGPLVFAYNAAVLFGLSAHIPAWVAIGVIPIFTWEVSLALWLLIKGFRASAIAPEAARPAEKELVSAA